MREAAAILLFREAGGGTEVYLQRRAGGMSFFSNAYVFPGGAADLGDPDLRHTAARELAEEAQVSVNPRDLVAYAHWITPSVEPKRFSATFYMTALPPGQEPSFDSQEVTDGIWLKLEEFATTPLYLPPPQLRTCFELAQFGPRTPAALIQAIGSRDPLPAPILPRGLPGAEPPTLLFPWDPDYPRGAGEGITLPPDHPQAFGPSRVVKTVTGWKLSHANG